MSTGHEDTESIFRLFRELKFDISGAIKDLFPFLEVLCDNNVISDKQYDDFSDYHRNLVQEVVYRVLEVLEERLDQQILRVLFCVENMKAYPDLEHIFERLKNGPTHPICNIEDFRRPDLPVTCGDAQGTLYVEKLPQGTHEKSIRTENGEWLTLREFEIRGNRERSKNWRQSICCRGWTLGSLIKGGILPDSPRTKGQRENRTSPE